MANKNEALARLDAEPVIEGEIELPLTPEELHEHEACVKRILDGFQIIARTSLEIWHDIQWIHDHRTWRGKYESWDEFCRDELGKDNSQIYRYLRDAKFKEALLLEASDDTERISIMNMKEANTRFIRTLPEDAQIPFWKLAYGFGVTILPHKEDGSIEPTTSFLESVGERVGELLQSGGVNIEGEFVSLDKVKRAGASEGITEEQAKIVLLKAGVSEEYIEALKRQTQHIREKSMKTDTAFIKGTVELKIDENGSEYPVVVDSKGNEYDVNAIICAFNNRFVSISLKAPIRE